MHEENTLTILGCDGAQTLAGEIPVFGSKNEALIAFPAALLFSDPVSIKNVPEIEDVHKMTELLKDAGALVTRNAHGNYTITAPEKTKEVLNGELVGKIRASVFLVGPMLTRYKEVTLPHPGGDNIGPRPIDLFIEGFQKMGAVCKGDEEKYTFSVQKSAQLCGADIFLRIPSVGATQSLMLAAIYAKGETVIKNAAMEPEISHLASFLNECGAKIYGAGTPEITITGGELLHAKGRTLSLIPDRIETGTFLTQAVLSGKDVTIKNCTPSHIEALLSLYENNTSADISRTEDTIRVQNTRPLVIEPMNVRNHEYPGLASDLQPPLVALLTQASGKSLVFETVYEERFHYVGNLVQMGAKIIPYDPHRIRVHGKTPLHGAVHTSPDIRAGLAYIIAALIAKGRSVIHNVYVIDRGYEKIEKRLRALGVDIERSA